MTLDLVVPAHNEREVILPTLKLLSQELNKIEGLSWRIIVAENGSYDDTYAVVQRAALPCVEIFSARQKGKGAAIKEALARSNADYFGWVDADCAVEPKIIDAALKKLEKEEAHLVIGSRFHTESIVDRGFYRQSTSRVFNLLAQTIVGIRINDTQCPLKIMDKHAKAILARCEEDHWMLDLELIAKVERSKLNLLTIPVEWKEFRYPKRESTLRPFRDGVHAIGAMIALRQRLNVGANNYGA